MPNFIVITFYVLFSLIAIACIIMFFYFRTCIYCGKIVLWGKNSVKKSGIDCCMEYYSLFYHKSCLETPKQKIDKALESIDSMVREWELSKER